MLHYFGFTIQLALLHVFYVKVKNLAFNASQTHRFLRRRTTHPSRF